MGIWDTGFFDNDMACDWENEIKHNATLGHIEEALKPIMNNSEDSLDIDVVTKALAGVAAIVRLLGHDCESNSYTKHLDKWAIEFKEKIPDELTKLALEAINRATNLDSELSQYWKIRGEYENWSRNIEKLKEYLS